MHAHSSEKYELIHSSAWTYWCDSTGRRSKPFREKLTLPLVRSSSQTLGLYCTGREEEVRQPSTPNTEDGQNKRKHLDDPVVTTTSALLVMLHRNLYVVELLNLYLIWGMKTIYFAPGSLSSLFSLTSWYLNLLGRLHGDVISMKYGEHHAGMVFALYGKAGSVKWLLILAAAQPSRVVKHLMSPLRWLPIQFCHQTEQLATGTAC